MNKTWLPKEWQFLACKSTRTTVRVFLVEQKPDVTWTVG